MDQTDSTWRTRLIFGWLRRRRRKAILAQPFLPAWRGLLNRYFAHWRRLDSDTQRRLEAIILVLMAEKDWVGCRGLQMTDSIKVIIAAQAGLLILELDHDYYRNVDSILVYPASYRLPGQRGMGGLVDGAERHVLGHAQMGGPVVLSWRSAKHGGQNAIDGRNLVYHEFAHKLDMLDGSVDGTPRLRSRRAVRDWIKVMTTEYEWLQRQVARRKKSLMDSYGATDVAEFFAVATETFFEKPKAMRRRHPEMYGVLSDFYGQNPAMRLTRA